MNVRNLLAKFLATLLPVHILAYCHPQVISSKPNLVVSLQLTSL